MILLNFLALVVSASTTGTCKVGYNGQCSSFNGQNIKQAFPSKCYLPLATGACGSDSWLIFFSTFTMTFNVRYEGIIYTVDNGTTFTRAEFSVALNLAGTVATITTATVPSNTCGLCNNNGKPECLSSITTTPLPTTTEKPTITEETTTVAVTSAPSSTCTVFTSGLYTDFNGCNRTTTFPSNSGISLAFPSEGDEWFVYYHTATMSFQIFFEFFTHTCDPGKKTVFGSVSVEVNPENTLAVIVVADMPSGILGGLCSSEDVECESTSLSPSEAPSTPEKTTEELTTAVSTSEVPSKESNCIVSTGGEYTGFNGCKSVTTFPPNTEIVLAKEDCDSEDPWIVYYSTITKLFNIRFKGFIYPCRGGNKTTFGPVSVEVNVELNTAIIHVDNMPSGIDCDLCGSESAECASPKQKL